MEMVSESQRANAFHVRSGVVVPVRVVFQVGYHIAPWCHRRINLCMGNGGMNRLLHTYVIKCHKVSGLRADWNNN